MSNKPDKTDGAELYCKVQIYNHLSHGCHTVVIRLPRDYMDMQDIEKYVKNQVGTVYISCLKIIGIGATVLGRRDSNA